jgi:CRP-like cAMP-binding protein
MTNDIAKKVERKFAGYPTRTYQKGQILVHAGDDPQYIYYIEEGKIRQYDISYRGDEIVVNVFKPGAFFPMLWAITETPNKYFFSAEEDTRMRIAPAQEIVEFLKDNGDVTFDLLTRVYTGVEGLLGRMVHLMSGSARSRLMYELVIECRRFGKQAHDGSWLLDITEADLAARAGLSRETVSRELQKVRKGGILQVGYGGIRIVDLPALETKLGTEL